MRIGLSTITVGVCLIGAAVSVLLFLIPTTSTVDFEVLPSEIQNIGFVRQGTSTEIKYALHNKTSDVIAIVNVGTSCGCTKSNVSKSELHPGESCDVMLTYNSGQSRGAIRVEAIVLYQRKGNMRPRTAVLTALAEIDPEYAVSPEHVVFSRQVESTKRITLSPKHCQKLSVERVGCDKRFFTAKLLPHEEGGAHVVEVTFDPSEYYQDAGPAHVTILTGNHLQPVVNVPLEVNQ